MRRPHRGHSLILGLLAAFAPASVGSGQELPESLVSFQRSIVLRLSGGAQIAGGLRLEGRASPENREAARVLLERLLDSLGLDPQRHGYRENGENVFAILPATVPSDTFVVVGAHFDTVERSPGANDNATGCAVVLGVAGYLAELSERHRNVIVVFFDEEERGLTGSRAFALKLQEEDRAVAAVHTVDQMGWDADGDGAVELELPYDGAVALYREAATRAGLSMELHVTEEAGSDHSAFRRLGMPAVGLTEEYRNDDTTPHIHRPSDSPATVDFAYLARTTLLMRAALEALVGPEAGNPLAEGGHRPGNVGSPPHAAELPWVDAGSARVI